MGRNWSNPNGNRYAPSALSVLGVASGSARIAPAPRSAEGVLACIASVPDSDQFAQVMSQTTAQRASDQANRLCGTAHRNRYAGRKRRVAELLLEVVRLFRDAKCRFWPKRRYCDAAIWSLLGKDWTSRGHHKSVAFDLP